MAGLGALARKIFGSANDRKVKSFRATVEQINALEPEIQVLSDDELRARTDQFREQYRNGASLDDLLVPAFATVREAAKRALGQRHYDVQLIGGMVLNSGRIAEMRTGEGKTLVATAPVYLNALTGRGVHVVTVNDYLAQRDSDWMGQVYRFLGLSVGCITHGLSDEERRDAYAADVTYGTNNEFGFDYLRDNMKHERESMVQRDHAYAIVDEVDSILIDEARTPLIISGPLEDRSDFYNTVDAFIQHLTDADFELDEKQRSTHFTEAGNEKLEKLLGEAGLLKGESLYDVENVSVVHHLQQALKAHKLFQRDKDYIVRNGEVVIIDEFTGRMMPGRRFSEGLHQALEAREKVRIQPENQTLASITFQNYFRMYDKLAGMTGTASTEADEFMDIYSLDVIEIPTNMPVSRIDDDDEVYRTAEEKYHAIVKLIDDCKERGQPILVGTTSIEKSEYLAELLKKHSYRQIDVTDPDAFAPLYNGDQGSSQEKIFAVLNARYHEQEAFIIAQAGLPGAVTIATNMAGRGTDIQLGGSIDLRLAKWRDEQRGLGIEPDAEAAQARRDEIEADIADLKEKSLAAGGLYVLGTERHESRRIDNQLRGRTGRQGDPGRSKFFLSCEDDLLRIFAGDRLDSIMRTFGVQEGEAITHKWLNGAIATAQKRVEQRNYEIRKNLLKYDDVVNDQRKAVFEQRQEFMEAQDLTDVIAEMRADTIEDMVNRHLPPKAYAEQWDIAGLDERVRELLGLELPVREWAAEDGIANEEIHERITEAAEARAAEREVMLSPERMRMLEKSFLLQTIDLQWREHLMHLDHLRNVIGLRGYGQRDPLNEYKTEAFSLFEKLLTDLRHNVTKWMMTVEIQVEPAPAAPPPPERLVEVHLDPLTGENAATAGALPSGMARDQREALPISSLPAGWEQTGRNAPCPCGSGKKFKHCHGALV